MTQLPQGVESFLEGMYHTNQQPKAEPKHEAKPGLGAKIAFVIFCLPCIALFNDAPEGQEINLWINLFGGAWMLLCTLIGLLIFSKSKGHAV